MRAKPRARSRRSSGVPLRPSEGPGIELPIAHRQDDRLRRRAVARRSEAMQDHDDPGIRSMCDGSTPVATAGPARSVSTPMSKADDPAIDGPRPTRRPTSPGRSPKRRPARTRGPTPAGDARPKPDEPKPVRDGSKAEARLPATGGPKLVERILFGRVSSGHLAEFCRQFSAYSTRASTCSSRCRASRSSSPGRRSGRSSAGCIAGDPRGRAARRRDGARAPGVRRALPEHDPGRRGPRRRPRDHAGAGRPLRGPAAADPPGAVGDDLPGRSSCSSRRRRSRC